MADRLKFLDCLKGIGIVLVVAGHSIGGVNTAFQEAPSGFLENLFYTIYTFHMPLFFFVSGLHVIPRLAKGAARFFSGLLRSIVFPYIIWSILSLLILYMTSGVRNGGADGIIISKSLIAILWAPPAWLWFFYVLFICHIIAILTSNRPNLLLIIAAIIYPFADFLNEYNKIIPYTAHFLLFYSLGVYFGKDGIKRQYFDQPITAAVGAIAVFAAWVAFLRISGYDYWSAQSLPAAVAGTAALYIVCSSTVVGESAVLGFLGKKSLSIYVLHVFFAAGARIAWLKLGLPANLELIAFVCVIAGVIGPLILDDMLTRLNLAAYFGLGTYPRRSNVSA